MPVAIPVPGHTLIPLCAYPTPAFWSAVNGQPCPAAEAVLPLREASWGWVDSASDLLQTGQAVRVSVLYAQTEPRSKVGGWVAGWLGGWVAGWLGGWARDSVGSNNRRSRHAVASPGAASCCRAALLACVCTALEALKPRACCAALLLLMLPLQVVVSLKRLENDPLKETLDNVLPLDQPSVRASAGITGLASLGWVLPAAAGAAAPACWQAV